MRKCLNCKWDVRDTDTYCRNCGCILQSNKSFIVTNVLLIIIILLIIGMIALFVASYLVSN